MSFVFPQWLFNKSEPLINCSGNPTISSGNFTPITSSGYGTWTCGSGLSTSYYGVGMVYSSGLPYSSTKISFWSYCRR